MVRRALLQWCVGVLSVVCVGLLVDQLYSQVHYTSIVDHITQTLNTFQSQLASFNNGTETGTAADVSQLNPQLVGLFTQLQKDGDKLTAALEAQTGRIICAVLTTTGRRAKMLAVAETWGRRCTQLLFFIAAASNDTIPKKELVEPLANTTATVITLKMQDGYTKTWRKVRLFLQYIDKTYSGQFEWLIRADDDTYIVMHNLRVFLSKRDPQASEYYGNEYKMYGGYVGTGAGLVLSAPNVHRVAQQLADGKCQQSDTHGDDLALSKCLQDVGTTYNTYQCRIRSADSRDARGRHRFITLTPAQVVDGKVRGKAFAGWNKYPIGTGFECCADDFIGFHYVKPDEMRLFEMLLYRFGPIKET